LDVLTEFLGQNCGHILGLIANSQRVSWGS